MADTQRQIPGAGYYHDVSEATLPQRQIPGVGYVSDTQQSAGGAAVFGPYYYQNVAGLGGMAGAS